ERDVFIRRYAGTVAFMVTNALRVGGTFGAATFDADTSAAQRDRLRPVVPDAPHRPARHVTHRDPVVDQRLTDGAIVSARRPLRDRRAGDRQDLRISEIAIAALIGAARTAASHPCARSSPQTRRWRLRLP